MQINVSQGDRLLGLGLITETGCSMVTRFKACDLGEDDLPRIQPLLNLAWSGGEVLPWLAPQGRVSGGADTDSELAGGAVYVERPDGYIAGLLCYRVIAHPETHRIFDCPVVILPEMVRTGRVLTILVDEAERRARTMRCSRLKMALTFLDEPVPSQANPLAQVIEDSGLAYHSILYAKDITEPTPHPPGVVSFSNQRSK
jgi:hypothetical protein